MEELKLNIYKMTYKGFWHGGRAIVIANSEDEAKEILLADEQILNLIHGKLKEKSNHKKHIEYDDKGKLVFSMWQDDFEESTQVKPTKDEILTEIIKMQKGVIFNDNGDE